MSMNIITIDGPAGSGKGTIGQQLALRLGWNFLDSGALYRSVGYFLLVNNLSIEDSGTLSELSKFDFRCVAQNEGEALVLLNGEDVGSKIRTAECGNLASKVATHGEIRKALLKIQRRYCRQPGLVADGRDMGSVVFPEAAIKVYLTASLQVRAQRKFKQLKAKEISIKYSKIYADIENRDLRDSTRSHAPLVVAEDAFFLDTSLMDISEVFQKVLDRAKSIIGRI